MKRQENATVRRLVSFFGHAVHQYAHLESRVLLALNRHTETTLRLAIVIVFLWFGVLKLIGRSPAAALVTATLEAFGIGFPGSVFALGIVEIVIGMMLWLRVAPRLTLLLFAGQQLGTFTVLVVAPGVAFEDGNPLFLTLIGEFVVKNLVLLTGGLTLARTIPPMQTRFVTAKTRIRTAPHRDSRPQVVIGLETSLPPAA
jgi:putative oxidoreductase